jgi:acetyl esterase
VREHAADFGGDPLRVAVGGDSAGGNLAAAVTQWARDTGAPLPGFQMLIYPVTDARLGSASMDLYADGYLLTRDLMVWFREHYLSSEAERLDPRVSPLLARDLAGLSPAFVATAGFDPLCDEGKAYAERLRAAGNAVSHRCYDGLIHGFFAMTASSPAARAAFEDAAGALRRAFGG